jgi:aryl-alcohol dehydrogenase-like predicted oxidoreductase
MLPGGYGLSAIEADKVCLSATIHLLAAPRSILITVFRVHVLDYDYRMTASAMAPRPFGRTGLNVSPLGLGAGRIGGGDLSEADVERLLGTALDVGVTLIDTARSYGLSEERIGRHLAHRRREFVLSTKGGYGTPGIPDWTGSCITEGINAALQRLRTDRIDIFHLHSCPLETLERGDVIDALESAVRAGKIRIAAYSGDAAPLAFAVRSGRFGSIQVSVNLCDQRILDVDLPTATVSGLGVIVKRPLANAPWRFPERPTESDIAIYWERFRTMNIQPGHLGWDELALRFTAFQPGVSACIVGTASMDHLLKNARLLERGPLPPETIEALRKTFQTNDRGWIGQV